MSVRETLEGIISHIFPGMGCKQLVKQTLEQITVTGVNFGISGYTFSLGGASNAVFKNYDVDKIMASMDQQQADLCRAINKISNPALKDECIKMQIQTILAFGQFEALSQDPVGNKDAIAEWAKTMNTLMKLNLEALAPTKPASSLEIKPFVAGVRSKSYSDVQKYLGIDEADLKKAVSKINLKKDVPKKK
jgi:hypothetical protein